MKKPDQKSLIQAAGVLLAVLGLFIFRHFVFEALKLVSISVGVALLLSPLCSIFEKKLSSAASALLSLAAAFLALVCIIFIIIFPLSKSLYELLDILPEILSKLNALVSPLLHNIGLNVDIGDIDLASIPFSFGGIISKFAYGAADAVSSVADIAVACVVAWYMLIDRKRLLLRLELLIPSFCRRTVLSCFSEARTEIIMYLRGQSIIAACVGLLSAFGLFLTGIPNGIPLGLSAGILNMIPYLGPFIACIPVGAVALTQGFLPFALSIGVLIAVQQIDGLVLSPRIVGSSTGFASAAVMISIFASGAVWGAIGMLLALPCMILIRTCGRVFVELRQNY